MDSLITNPLSESELNNNDGAADNNAPLSYIDWKRGNIFLSETNSEDQYNLYLIQWFSNNKKKTISSRYVLKQKYLYLLDQLQLFFTDEEKHAWYNQINLADDNELLLAIPYFARRLKDISLYYLNLRKKLANTKTKYNLVGSVKGIEQEIYTYVLENFTLSGKNPELNPKSYQTLPSFAEITNSLNVEIEELYDDKQYHDISPSQSLSTYYNFSHDSTAQYLASKGIDLSTSEWMFKLFDASVTDQTFYTTFSNITSVVFDTTDEETYQQFIQKYLAENKYVTSYVPRLTSTTSLNVSLGVGNNYFYYPYGTNSSTFAINQVLPVVALSSLQIEGAVAGDQPSNSDTIIVKYGNTTKSAWLRNIDYISSNKTVKAIMNRENSTLFIFPFPGYGLSGQDLDWTGPSLETNQEYNFLTRELKASVNQAYWSQELPPDTCSSVLLNNTTLASNGATPHKDPRFADHFYLRLTRDTDTTIPYGENSGAWLYKFDQTSLPVSTISDNVYLWPYQRLDINQGFPSHLANIDFTESCNSVPVQDLPTSYFVAASSITYADKIYKLNNYAESTQTALECAWLSGNSVTVGDYNTVFQDGIEAFFEDNEGGYRYIEQDGFAGLFVAGEATKFIWSGPVVLDERGNAIGTSLEDVFKTLSHKADCPFVTNIPETHNHDWENCSCKQVYHTPFGHPYKTFAHGNYFADCIFEVADQDIGLIDFGSWRDKSGRSITESGINIKFAWYKTSKISSWGNGKWVTNSGQLPFKLMPGKCYIYVRANSREQTTSFPPYAATYSFNTNRTVWVEAKKDSTGENWISTGNISKMELFPGDFVAIERRSTITNEILSSTYVSNTPSNQNSLWSTYDTVPVNCKSFNTISITWPKDPRPFKSTNPQYPPFNFSELKRVDAWSIQRAEDGVIEYYINPTTSTSFSTVSTSLITTIPKLTSNPEVYSGTTTAYANGTEEFTYTDIFDTVSFIVPNVVGTYVISLTATSKSGTTVTLTSATIPPIICIPEFSLEYVSIPFETPTCGFLLEKKLKGWSYNRNKRDVAATGARPYWAVLDTEKNQTTRYKGLYSWGYPEEYLDEYIPASTPIVSPIDIEYGSIIEYRRKGTYFTWNQPIVYQQYSGTTQWSVLSADFERNSNFSSLYEIKSYLDPVGIPLKEPTDILLSNFVDGDPLEVFYYATNPVEWTIEYQTEEKQEPSALSSLYIAEAPWMNLTNRFNPTVASIPVLEEAYTMADVGGYFLPKHLGASQFVNKNYTVLLDTDKLTGTNVTESPEIHIGGRGLTKQDQYTIYDWTEDNQWLKESITTGGLAGTIKKSLTKALQTFIPYQSNVKETTLGLITQNTKFSPWGGVGSNEWIDSSFDTVGFTGIRSVSAWANAQIIKQSKKDIEDWCSDIYGNQYGLFKSLEGQPFYLHTSIGGELWVKLNNQIALPGTTALSKTFDQFAGILSTEAHQDFYNNNIQMVNCYFDTLFLKTPNIAIFTNLLFDYNKQEIETIFDDTRWIILSKYVRHEKNWFFPAEKRVVILVTKFQEVNTNTIFYPCLYELDLTTKNLKVIFELNPNEIRKIYFKDKIDCSFSYEGGHNKFLITYSGINKSNDKLFFLDYYITNEPICKLHKCSLYEDRSELDQIVTPPFVTYNYLTAYSATPNTTFNIRVPVINTFNSIKILNNTNIVASVSADVITFTGKLTAGLHHINYNLKNPAGESNYCLTVNSFS